MNISLKKVVILASLLVFIVITVYSLWSSNHQKDKAEETVTLNVLQNRKDGAPHFLKMAGVDIKGYNVNYMALSGSLFNSIAGLVIKGDVDLAWMTEISTLYPANQKDAANNKLKIIGTRKGQFNDLQIVIPENSSAKTFADLKGKRIAYYRSAAPQYFLTKLLEEQGWDFSDIQPLTLTEEDAYAAFQRGEVDAWVVLGLPALRAQSKLNAKVLMDAAGYVSGNYLLVTNQDVIDDPKKYQALQDYIANLDKVWQWSQAHPEQLANHLSEMSNIPASWFLSKHYSWPWLITSATDDDIRSHQQVADFMYEQKMLSQPVQVNSLWYKGFKPQELKPNS